jgi:hypothetical protein
MVLFELSDSEQSFEEFFVCGRNISLPVRPRIFDELEPGLLEIRESVMYLKPSQDFTATYETVKKLYLRKVSKAFPEVDLFFMSIVFSLFPGVKVLPRVLKRKQKELGIVFDPREDSRFIEEANILVVEKDMKEAIRNESFWQKLVEWLYSKVILGNTPEVRFHSDNIEFISVYEEDLPAIEGISLQTLFLASISGLQEKIKASLKENSLAKGIKEENINFAEKLFTKIPEIKNLKVKAGIVYCNFSVEASSGTITGGIKFSLEKGDLVVAVNEEIPTMPLRSSSCKNSLDTTDITMRFTELLGYGEPNLALKVLIRYLKGL